MSDVHNDCKPADFIHEFNGEDRCQCGEYDQANIGTLGVKMAAAKSMELLEGTEKAGPYMRDIPRFAEVPRRTVTREEFLADSVQPGTTTVVDEKGETRIVVNVPIPHTPPPDAMKLTDVALYTRALEALNCSDDEDAIVCLQEFMRRVGEAKNKAKEIHGAALRGDISALWSTLFMHYLAQCEAMTFATPHDTVQQIKKKVETADKMAQAAMLVLTGDV